MKPSVRDLEHALSIRRQINALEKRLAAILRGSIAKPKARRRPYEYDHHYGLTLSGTKKKGIGNQIDAAFVASFGGLMNTSHPTLFYVSK